MVSAESVDSSEFDSFYQEIHNHKPHMWQSVLAKKVCADGWPCNISLPTGSGKTSVIDIGVFYLATQATLGYNRKAHTRIVYVVDRRLIVDDAYTHAVQIADALQKPQGLPTVSRVAEALNFLRPRGWSSNRPLDVIRMRGGTGSRVQELNSPTSPTVIVSTVDQIGSRLLFRGYGVTDRSRPIHAGRLSSDCVYVLDEAHLSRPFVGTVRQISAMQDRLKDPRPITAVSLGATIDTSNTNNVFPGVGRKRMLEDLGKVFTTRKPAEMLTVGDVGASQKLAEHALSYFDENKPDGQKEHTEDMPVTSVAVIVNRVAEARDVFEQIRTRLGSRSDIDAHLLTGLSRPIDRKIYAEGELRKIGVMRSRMVFVATQCIEAGVDVSFDAMVTKAAPIDSLRQRFGRVNRKGDGPVTTAKIVAVESELDDKKTDPIYGTSVSKAWEYLKSIAVDGVVDFGSESLDDLTTDPPDGLEEMLAPSPPEPEILPTYVRLWNNTHPTPFPDPNPAMFLHGPGNRPADVLLVWRSELSPDMCSRKIKREPMLLSPPAPGESMSIPIWTIKSWLSNMEMADVADVEGAKEPDSAQPNEKTKRPNIVIKRGYGRYAEYAIATPSNIMPGDTVIVSTRHGGCDRYGWTGTPIQDQHNAHNVKDLAVEASLQYRRLPIKINKESVRDMCGEIEQDRDFSYVWNDINQIVERAYDNPPDSAIYLVEEILGVEGLPSTLHNVLQIVQKTQGTVKLQYETRVDGNGVVSGIMCSRLERTECERIAGILGVSDAIFTEMGQYYGRSNVRRGEIKLDEHCASVERVVKEFGRGIVSEQCLDDISCAAFLHDIGKSDKRFQACLRGKVPSALPEQFTLLAKSADEPSLEKRRENRKRAGLPEGYRHEVTSIVAAQDHPRIKSAHDRDLVLYLIGTHHGYGRALFPPVTYEQDTHSHDTVFPQWLQIVEKTYKKYGPFQLASMESILRLADWAQSGYERHGARNRW